MIIDTNGSSMIPYIKEAYNGIKLISDNGEEFFICNRDNGFEIMYNGIKYEAKNGKLDVARSEKLNNLLNGKNQY